MPCTTTRAFFVRRTARLETSRLDSHREFGGFLDRFRGMRPYGPQDLFRDGFVHSLDPGHDGHLGVHLLDRLFHARRDRVRLLDPDADWQEVHAWVSVHENFVGLLTL